MALKVEAHFAVEAVAVALVALPLLYLLVAEMVGMVGWQAPHLLVAYQLFMLGVVAERHGLAPELWVVRAVPEHLEFLAGGVILLLLLLQLRALPIQAVVAVGMLQMAVPAS